MATGFGADPTWNAGKTAITSGTSGQDLRRVLGGLYNEGILSGCTVTRTSSTNPPKYQINTGVANNFIAGGAVVGSSELVLMPIASSLVSSTNGPGSGTRTDYVYAKQNQPTPDGNSDITYGVSNTPIPSPDPRLVLATFSVPSGMTNTLQATQLAEINYATPYGASGRYLVNKLDTYNGLVTGTPADLAGSFSVSTERMIEIHASVTVDYDGLGELKDGLYVELYINGVRKIIYSTGRIDELWQTPSWTLHTTVPAGTHTVVMKRREIYNTNKIRLRYAPNLYAGTQLIVKDAGVLD